MVPRHIHQHPSHARRCRMVGLSADGADHRPQYAANSVQRGNHRARTDVVLCLHEHHRGSTKARRGVCHIHVPRPAYKLRRIACSSVANHIGMVHGVLPRKVRDMPPPHVHLRKGEVSWPDRLLGLEHAWRDGQHRGATGVQRADEHILRRGIERCTRHRQPSEQRDLQFLVEFPDGIQPANRQDIRGWRKRISPTCSSTHRNTHIS